MTSATRGDEFSQRIQALAADWAGRVLGSAHEAMRAGQALHLEQTLLEPARARLRLNSSRQTSRAASSDVAPASSLALQTQLTPSLQQLVTLSRDPAAVRAEGGPIEVPDMLGHRRDVYYPFALHLHLAAVRQHAGADGREIVSTEFGSALREALMPVRAVRGYADGSRGAVPHAAVAVVLWQVLVMQEAILVSWHGWDDAERSDEPKRLIEQTQRELDALVQRIVTCPGPENSLHPRSPDDSLDAWTYRELAGLHALMNLSQLRERLDWRARVIEVAQHHLENTQPDNTTTQPWAVHAFLADDSTATFAEQQLHDATTWTASAAARMSQQSTGAAGLQVGVLSAALLVDALGPGPHENP